MATDDPSLEDVIRTAMTSALGGIRTSLIGVIQDYDEVKQTCTVQVLIKSSYLDGEDGIRVFYVPEPISNCPVRWPAGGGDVYADTFPLKSGDLCLVMVTDRSTDEWKSTANQADYEPQDPRRFDLTDAFVEPGSRSPAAPLPAAALDSAARVMMFDFLKMGSSSASQWMAIADLILTRLNSIEGVLNGHTHGAGTFTVSTAPGAVTGLSGASGDAGSTTLDDIRSQKVKSE